MITANLAVLILDWKFCGCGDQRLLGLQQTQATKKCSTCLQNSKEPSGFYIWTDIKPPP